MRYKSLLLATLVMLFAPGCVVTHTETEASEPYNQACVTDADCTAAYGACYACDTEGTGNCVALKCADCDATKGCP